MQEAAADGFVVQPSITDAVTHLGAILDTDQLQNGVPAPARVPVGLGVYKPQPLGPRVKHFILGLCSGACRAVPGLSGYYETSIACICMMQIGCLLCASRKEEVSCHSRVALDILNCIHFHALAPAGCSTVLLIQRTSDPDSRGVANNQLQSAAAGEPAAAASGPHLPATDILREGTKTAECSFVRGAVFVQHRMAGSGNTP